LVREAVVAAAPESSLEAVSFSARATLATTDPAIWKTAERSPDRPDVVEIAPCSSLVQDMNPYKDDGLEAAPAIPLMR
jgi:hypothetical protein